MSTPNNDTQPLRDIVVLSDLHLGRGKNHETGRYFALEAFFYDDDFLRFCRYLCDDAKRRGVELTIVLNGDVFDLLRIEPEQAAPTAPLIEKRFGAAQTPAVAARVVGQILAGHPTFVRGLAELLALGHEVVMLPGNHDVEVQWEPVHEVIRRAVRTALDDTCTPDLVDPALARLRFAPWFHYEPGRVWIEHGCQYDPECAFRYPLRGGLKDAPDAVLEAEYDLPLGNFFQRYLYNAFGHITFIVPSARANLRYFKHLLVNEPRLLLNVIASHVPFAVQVLRRFGQSTHAARHTLKRLHEAELEELAKSSGLGDKLKEIDKLKEVRADLVQAGRSIGVQLLRTILAVGMGGLFTFGLWFLGFASINELAAGFGLKAVLFLALNFFMLAAAGGTLAWSMLRNQSAVPERPIQRAAQRLVDHLDVPIVVFGHTHDEVLVRLRRPSGGKAWYYNTGTWIAVFTHDVLLPRERVQYTFLRIRGHDAELLHWSPGRREPLQVILLDELPNDWAPTFLPPIDPPKPIEAKPAEEHLPSERAS